MKLTNWITDTDLIQLNEDLKCSEKNTWKNRSLEGIIDLDLLKKDYMFFLIYKRIENLKGRKIDTRAAKSGGVDGVGLQQGVPHLGLRQGEVAGGPKNKDDSKAL